ncbi:hypothetical protein BdWA1_002233 [Babesia duncani]|uniref:Uncharacterized protein n=1 Tax=Babesia duncani TaxID=323732 RepID=A0AAD9PLG3_9APIC|nr:hypothetical protein BdWA1_002233 [Babesia duncani]
MIPFTYFKRIQNVASLKRLLQCSPELTPELIKFAAFKASRTNARGDRELARMIQDKAVTIVNTQWNSGELLTLLMYLIAHKIPIHEDIKSLVKAHVRNLQHYTLLDLSQLITCIRALQLEDIGPIVEHFIANIDLLVRNGSVKNLNGMLNSLYSVSVRLDSACVDRLLHLYSGMVQTFQDHSNFINAIARHMEFKQWDSMSKLIAKAKKMIENGSCDLEGLLDCLDALRLLTLDLHESPIQQLEPPALTDEIYKELMDAICFLNGRIKSQIQKCPMTIEPRLARIAFLNWSYFNIQNHDLIHKLLCNYQPKRWSFQGLFNAIPWGI